jgi:hypothetical protein
MITDVPYDSPNIMRPPPMRPAFGVRSSTMTTSRGGCARMTVVGARMRTGAGGGGGGRGG